MSRGAKLELRRLLSLPVPDEIYATNVPSRGIHPNSLKSYVSKYFLDESGLLK
jgi:hypothetical protein